jgi:hypothetical protein
VGQMWVAVVAVVCCCAIAPELVVLSSVSASHVVDVL